MAEQYVNGVSTTLSSGINNSQTTCAISSTTGFPATGDFHCLISAEGANNDELVTVTARSGSTLTIVRASEAYGGVQSASPHGAGAVITIVLTAASLPTGGGGSGVGDKLYLYSTQR